MQVEAELYLISTALHYHPRVTLPRPNPNPTLYTTQVPSAADLIRTASHDRSSHSLSYASGLRVAHVPAAYSVVERTGYYRPSDRIGRLYTATAAALTSVSAQSVAKAAAALAVASGAPTGGGGGSRARAGGGENS